MIRNGRDNNIPKAVSDQLLNETTQAITNSKIRGMGTLILMNGLSDSELSTSAHLQQLSSENFAQTQNSAAELEKRGFKVEPIAYMKDSGMVSEILVTKNDSLKIPSWVKNSVKMWSTGQIDDSEFIKEIQYLIQKGIITTLTVEPNPTSSQQIPSWIKTNAEQWISGQSSNDEFVISVIQNLESIGIIKPN